MSLRFGRALMVFLYDSLYFLILLFVYFSIYDVSAPIGYEGKVVSYGRRSGGVLQYMFGMYFINRTSEPSDRCTFGQMNLRTDEPSDR